MTLRELILKNRTFRRFHQDVPIDETTLKELVDLGRLSASGGNQQSLKYLISATPERNALIFPFLAWAAYLKDWKGPAEGERPAAYILILGDTAINKTSGVDHGISAQSILLGAAELGLGGCMIGSVQREPLRRALNLPERYEILLVLAIGKPDETVVLETVKDDDIRYWRDEHGVHHVPKRSLKDVLITI